jgi:hypothetical protein
MDLEFKHLDEACMQFEDRWSKDQPVCFVFDFFGTVSSHFKDPAPVILELCQIDMQRRWQAWNSKSLSSMSVEQVNTSFSQIPRVRNYLTEAKERNHIFGPTAEIELKSCEFASRQKYGDLPCPSEADDEVQPAKLATLKRPLAIIQREGTEVFRHAIWGKTTVGRQAKGEPKFPGYSEEHAPAKLICSEGSDPSISREQFSVAMASSQFAIITNGSRNRCFTINKHRVVEPDTSEVIGLPFDVELGHTIVSFRRLT